MRRTHALVSVAVALMSDVDGRHWGYALSRTARVRSGVLYPILHRMLDQGWLADGWESSSGRKRPPRRYYTVTDVGRRELGQVISDAVLQPRFLGVPGLANGSAS